jgi:N-acyl-D-aspartate/D-glutamate deacylase
MDDRRVTRAIGTSTMTNSYDLVIRNGDIADGSGRPIYTANIAILDGKIVEVGQVLGSGREEIDARGKLVTPGFVDIHTHYDGQATWDTRLASSSWNGVTTVVMGNCSVGFAPVRRPDIDTLIELMEGVEDIPGAVLHEGLKWSWTSFPEYLDALDAIPHDIDICAQLPHSPLRVFVMGQRAVDHEPATENDIARMRALTCEAVLAGAIGVSTSRTPVHKTSKGEPIPTLHAREAEIRGLAMGLRDAGSGVIQAISEWEGEHADDLAMLKRIVAESGRPLSFSVGQYSHKPEAWKSHLADVEEARRDGLPITGQVAIRAIGFLTGLQASRNPFIYHPSYQQIDALPLDEKVAAMRDPALKEHILDEGKDLVGGSRERQRNTLFHMMFPVSDPPDYEPSPEMSVAAMAARQGRDPMELAYELLLEHSGRDFLYQPVINYADGDLEVCRRLLASDATVPGVGDGGAHVAFICDSSNPTFLLTHWGRDRPHGRFDVAWLVKRHTLDTARTVGLLDRGLIAPGMKADINVIDFDKLRLRRPVMAYDLPAGGRRLTQKAEGYEANIVSGVITYRQGEATGALPGRLVRGQQAAPNSIAA